MTRIPTFYYIDAMLNQTDIKNNNNKFYIIQLLKSDITNEYYVWMRWGRVGKAGQNSFISCSSINHAVSIFSAKFRDKVI